MQESLSVSETALRLGASAVAPRHEAAGASASLEEKRRGAAAERSADGPQRADRVELSPEGLERADTDQAEESENPASLLPAAGVLRPEEADETGDEDGRGGELSEEEQREVSELQARNAEVRAHEQAHAAVGGSLAGAPSYEYERGPDGRDYAVGGEVSIQLKKGRDPEETLRNAEQARRAAEAPAEPSAQDQRVAARARQMASKARGELRAERQEEPEALEEPLTDTREPAAPDDARRAVDAYGQPHVPAPGDERAAHLSVLA